MAPPTLSSLCALGWRPILITGLLRDQLTRHFSTPLNIETGDLRHLVWREDVRTGILIESIHRWRGDLVEKRPAVIIKRNAIRNLRLAIGDALSGGTEHGQRQFTTFWVGSHTVFCIHGSGASAEILGTEVQRELTQFAEPLISELGLLRWQVTEIGEVAEIEEAREGFVVPLTVGWAYHEAWLLERETPRVRRIDLSTLLDGALLDDC